MHSVEQPCTWCPVRDPVVSKMNEEELQIALDESVKELLERAAAASHLSLPSFVLQAAAQRAEEVLAERATIRLSPTAAAAFTKALSAPPQSNERLADALDRPAGFVWTD